MQSQVLTQTYVIGQADVLYVAQQVLNDLRALSQAYPRVLTNEAVMDLFNSITTFLYNDAISELGFTIHDPLKGNRVYHEYRYEILYGDAVLPFNPGGQAVGRGGKPVTSVYLPASAKFDPWVVWSAEMLGRSEWEQENIVSGTHWDIPSRCKPFTRRFEGGSWVEFGFYGRGYLGVKGSEFRNPSGR